jgi:regulator of CtrA degradation
MGAMQKTTLLLERTYSELFDLIVETRDYLEESQKARVRRKTARSGSSGGSWPDRESGPEPGLERMRIMVTRIDEAQLSCETMRMTSRLTQAMAWLMVQKAVHHGELTSAEASEERYRLGGHEVCLAERHSASLDMPPELRRLMDRSLSVYRRIERLDRMLDAT